MDGVRTAEGDEGATGEISWAPLGQMGGSADGLQALLGVPMAACSGCGEGDGGIGHGKRRSRTGMARVGGDVQSVADGRRQAGSGMARNRARARVNWVSQGQRCGRCRVRRRAERVIRPAREKNRRRRVLVVTICSPRPMRAVQRASNCVGCQEGWAISAGHEPRHGELFLTIAFRMVSSLRIQATRATFFVLPAASSLW